MKKKGLNELQINNKNDNYFINKKEYNKEYINNYYKKTEKVPLIPILLPRITSPSLKENFKNKKTNLIDKSNNFNDINNNNISKINFNRGSLKAKFRK